MPRLSSITARVLVIGIIAAFGCSGDTPVDALTPEDATVLSTGVAVTGISGAAGSQQLYRITVPPGNFLSVLTYGGTGNVDVFVKENAVPGGADTDDCASEGEDNNESCSLPVAAVDWYILLVGVEAYGDVTLLAQYMST